VIAFPAPRFLANQPQAAQNTRRCDMRRASQTCALFGGAFVAMIVSKTASADSYKIGEVEINLSGVATAGAAIRTTPRNPALISAVNGKALGVPATAKSGANQDDGNLNWAPGDVVSSVAKAFATIDAHYQDYGIFLRGKTWGDFTAEYQNVPWGSYANGYAAGAPLSDHGFSSRARFVGGVVQEAYAHGKQRQGEATVEERIGEITVPWGIQTMIPGGLAYSVNGFDSAAIVRPGAQAEETLVPTPGAFTRLGFFQDKLKLDAFYLFEGPENALPGCGTFFSLDWIAQGCSNVYFATTLSDPQAYATNYALNRATAPSHNDPNFGFGASYQADPLHTKFGLYYAHVNSPVPIGDGVKTSRSGSVYWAVGNPSGGNAAYTVEYPGAVDTVAVNFKTQIALTTTYGEYVYSANRPVAFNGSDVIAAVVSPQSPTPLRAIYNSLPLGAVMEGYERLQTGNLDIGVIQTVPNALNAAALVLGAEFGLKQVYDLPADLRFGRSDVYGQGPIAGVVCSGNALQCSNNGYVTSNAWGYRLNAALQYENVLLSGLKLTPSIGLIHDVSGWSYDGVFNQGRLSLPLKIRADYRARYFVEAAWTPALRVAPYDNVSDRQFVSFAAGVRF